MPDMMSNLISFTILFKVHAAASLEHILDLNLSCRRAIVS